MEVYVYFGENNLVFIISLLQQQMYEYINWINEEVICTLSNWVCYKYFAGPENKSLHVAQIIHM